MKKKMSIAALSILIATAFGLPASSAEPKKMYWEGVAVDTTTLHRANLDGSDIENLFSCSVVCGMGPLAIDPIAEKIYFVVVWEAETLIERENLDGSDHTNILNLGETIVASLAVDVVGNKIYWSQPTGITRANLDGSGVESVLDGLTAAKGISVHGADEKIYWTEEGPTRLRRANLDGSAIEDLLVAGGSIPFSRTSLDLAIGKIYWIAGDTIGRANLDGSSPETLPVFSLRSPVGLAVDSGAQQIYVGTPRIMTPPTAPSKILRVDPVTNQVVEILTGVGASELALDGGSSEDVPAVTGKGLAAMLLLLAVSVPLVLHRLRAS